MQSYQSIWYNKIDIWMVQQMINHGLKTNVGFSFGVLYVICIKIQSKLMIWYKLIN